MNTFINGVLILLYMISINALASINGYIAYSIDNFTDYLYNEAVKNLLNIVFESTMIIWTRNYIKKVNQKHL